MLENDTIVDGRVRPEVSVWLAPSADAELAVRRLAEIEQRLVVRVAKMTVEGVRIAVSAEPVAAAQRAAAIRFPPEASA